jgi:hypothetical protein
MCGNSRRTFDDRRETDVTTAIQLQRLCLMMAGLAIVVLPLSGAMDLSTPASVVMVAVGLLFTSRIATRMVAARPF